MEAAAEKKVVIKDRVNVINYTSENQLKRLKGTLYYKKNSNSYIVSKFYEKDDKSYELVEMELSKEEIDL